MVHYDRISELHSWRSDWKICVKVLRKWRKIDQGEDTVEIIFCDVFGDKIQGTISNDLFLQFNNDVHENDWKIVSNFSIIPETSPIKIVDNNYRIRFMEETVLDDSEPVSSNHFIDYQSFDRLFDGFHAVRNVCLVRVEPILHVDNPNAVHYHERCRLVRFCLTNLEGHEIQCVAYNEHADFFDNNWWPTGSKPIVAVLRYWREKYTSGGQRIELLSVPGASTIVFDPLYTEVVDFYNRLIFTTNSGVMMKVMLRMGLAKNQRVGP
ncbi:uncharacterized protein LOC111829484 [Capsella rubella]|uniref:uncharacterized protein LOC111829484 n=1 Tax=Capsella rubella TaxID=81985 RepID=UPI000CD58AC4|nr:uncharacterized protein LOC111829484 [Capsella rubella]